MSTASTAIPPGDGHNSQPFSPPWHVQLASVHMLVASDFGGTAIALSAYRDASGLLLIFPVQTGRSF
jgi:hypothetical protein